MYIEPECEPKCDVAGDVLADIWRGTRLPGFLVARFSLIRLTVYLVDAFTAEAGLQYYFPYECPLRRIKRPHIPAFEGTVKS